MADDPKPKESSKGEDTLWLLLLAALLFGAVIIPLALAVLLYLFVLRGRLSRLEYSMVTVACAAGLFLGGGQLLGDYFSWLGVLVVGGGSRLAAPLLPVALLTGVFLGVTGLVDGTKVSAKLPEFFRQKSLGDKPSIIPSQREKESVSVVAPPVLTTSASLHAIDQVAEPGKRPFPIGIDARGRPVTLTEQEIGTHALIFGATGSGKALALDTPIPTPSGWTTMGELTVGDTVFDEDGQPCRVTMATPVQLNRSCYEVEFSDGSIIVADADHRWLTETRAARVSASRAERNEARRRRADGRDQRHKQQVASVVTTAEIAATLHDGAYTNHSVPVAAAIDTPVAELPVDPYVLGAWLGDGSARHGGFTSADPFIVSEIAAAGYPVRRWSARYAYPIKGLLPQLRSLGLLKPAGRDLRAAKHIPATYLRASRDQRLALLQGLMDTGGHVTAAGGCEFDTTSRALAEGVAELVCSLGIQARIRESRAQSQGRDGGPRWRISFMTTEAVCRLPRKAERLPSRLRTAAARRYITDVRPVPSVPVRCIQVDSPNHLFLAGRSFIPTHNSETIKVIAGGLCDLGWSGMILDLKEDTKPGGLRDWCYLYAQHHAMPYQELRLSDPDPSFWFNALAGLSQDEARDTILSLTRFDDEYYQNVSKKVLGQLLKLMYWAHQVDPVTCPAPTMYDIAQILSSPSLAAATKKMRAIVTANVPGVSESEFQVLSSPQKVEQDQATSWGAKLGNLYETQAGLTVLRPTSGDRRMLDVTKPGLIYVGLDSQGKKDLTKVISSAVLQRLSVDAAQRTTGTAAGPVTPKFLIVDEANWVDRTIVQNLLSRARSAGICMMLSTQGPKDWIDKDGNDFAKLGQNTNVAIIMRQGEPESAELCADYIGKVEHLSTTYIHQDGEMMSKGSIRQETSHLVTPDQLRQLQIGEAVVRVGAPNTRTEWVKVIRRDPETRAGALPAGPAPKPAHPHLPRIRPPKVT